MELIFSVSRLIGIIAIECLRANQAKKTRQGTSLRGMDKQLEELCLFKIRKQRKSEKNKAENS